MLLPVPPPPAPRAEVAPPRDVPHSPVAVRRPAAATSAAGRAAATPAVRYFPIASRAAEGSPTLELSNPGAEPARVSVRLLERDRDNTAAPSRDVLLAPRDSVRIRDPLATLGAEGPEEMLEVRVEGPAAVALARDDDDPASGSTRRQVPWIAREHLSPSLELVGVRQENDAGAEIVLLNPNGEGASIALTLVGPASTLGRTTLRVPPNGFTAAPLSELFPDAEIPRDENLSVVVDAGSLPVYAAARARDAAAATSPAELPLAEPSPRASSATILK